MPGIYIMGAITLVVSALVWGAVLYNASGRQKNFLWLLLPGLPLSWAVNLLVKAPLTVWVGQVSAAPMALNPAAPLWFKLYAAFLAPVTEEAVKLLPLVVLALVLPLFGLAWPLLKDRRTALYAGLALGMSFGLGEVIYLAYAFGQAPQYAAYPWYYFGGFLTERLAVVFAHGALTAIAAAGLARGGWWAPAGFLAAVLGHAFVNLGALLIALQVISPAAAQIPFLLALIGLWLVFSRLRKAVQLPAEAAGDEEVLYERE
jgi:hypothetical protein